MSAPAGWRLRTACALAATQLTVTAYAADSSMPAALTPDAMARCAAIQANDQRLACYDGMARGLGLHPASNVTAAPAAGTAAPSSPTTQSPALAAAQPASGVAAAAVNGNDPKLFGLSKPVEPVARGPESLQATVVQISTDSVGTTYVQLNNDQTWTLSDANVLLRQGDAVVIKRAALGSFLLLTPSKRSYRARRIK